MGDFFRKAVKTFSIFYIINFSHPDRQLSAAKNLNFLYLYSI
ncbi:hypothetical protein B4096_0826 [Heyndrickxia coagulans]|nr:hypothetical protein B4096_0826 [Heyndrickxia coagulans]